MTISTLKNGLVVANFSSPHPFVFDDGTVLSAVSNEDAEKYKVTFKECLIPDYTCNCMDVVLSFHLSSRLMERVKVCMEMFELGTINRVLVPLPMLTALKEKKGIEYIKRSPFRCIRIEDRVNKVISSTKFCI